MSSLKEQAMAYVPNETKNIVDLKKVPVDIEIFEKTANKGEDNEFSYEYVEVDEVEYRVPKSVKKQLKALLAVEADTEFIAVTKTGTTMSDTVYFVRRVN